MTCTKYFEWSVNALEVKEPRVAVTFDEQGVVTKVVSLTSGKHIDLSLGWGSPSFYYLSCWKEVKKSSIERI